MKRKSSWDWYGVRVIKHIIVEGEPDVNLIDGFYDEDDGQLFEKTIVLVRVQS